MSVTKILLRHNGVSSSELPLADDTRCCEPLWFKNKLYIRSQNAAEIVDRDEDQTDEEWAAAVAQYRAAHPDGSPVFIGPYEHPQRNLNTVGTNVTETVNQNTGVSKIAAIHTTPSAENSFHHKFHAISSVEVSRDLGHTVTANAEFSISIAHPYDSQTGYASVSRLNTFDANPAHTLFLIGDANYNYSVGFQELGHGFIDLRGTLLPNSEYQYYEDPDDPDAELSTYDHAIGNGDCLVVTDADFSTTVTTPMPYTTSVPHDPNYNHMIVRSKITFDTTQTDKYLCRDGNWKTPDAGPNVAASPGDTSVKGVIAGSVAIDGEPTEFTVQPANSYLGGKSGAYYYTGQGVVRPLGTTTGLQTENKRKLLYTSEDTTILNQLCPTILRQPASVAPGTETEPQKAKWVAIPVFVDYHKVDGTDRVEAVPYIMLPENLLRGVLEYWQERTQSSSETEGTEPVGENIIADDSNYSE